MGCALGLVFGCYFWKQPEHLALGNLKRSRGIKVDYNRKVDF